MKITLINVLFIFIFALAASSTPLPVDRDQHPQAVPEVQPSELVILPGGKHVYTIDGKKYNDEQVAQEVTHLNLVLEHHVSLPQEKITTAQKVVIESDRLEILHHPNLKTDYDERRDGIHIFMGVLLDRFLLPNSRMECDAVVKLLAENALQTFLDLESENHYTYDDIRPKQSGPPSLTDEKYLQDLRDKLKRLIAQDTKGTEMETDLQKVPHKGKRPASDSGSDNGRRKKFREIASKR